MSKAKLGIDTGGTYTDAVLMDEAGQVLATAKSVTTRHDLSIGIGLAVRAVLADRLVEVELVGLSTTLATNAIVEGRGGRAGLIMIGFGKEAMVRGGLDQALRGDPAVQIGGGHDAHGLECQPLDQAALANAIDQLAGQVDALAITAAFAVRNPAHELAAAQMVAERSALPITMSHQLTARLDGPKRALTTLLNARLVPDISHLLTAVEHLMAELGIEAPIMVVRGDGSLMRAATVRQRPVETILSGPAASVIGAATLGGLTRAMIADVGGTTTDIALLEDGRPKLDPKGALVGGFQTMVEAIELRTSGLGGDSCLNHLADKSLSLGPERHIPLSLLAMSHPSILASLEAQLERPMARALDAQFATLVRVPAEALGRSHQALIDLLQSGPRALEQIIEREHLELPLKRLVARGLVAIAGFTPSDAAHCLGRQTTWDRRAAELGALLEARKQLPTEALSAQELALTVLRLAQRSTVLALVGAANHADFNHLDPWLTSPAVRHAADPAVNSGGGVLQVQLGLDRPIIAVGGPAALFYPEAARKLGVDLCLPEHYAVANAIGAVSGDVVRRLSTTITQLTEDRFAYQIGHERRESDDAKALANEAETALQMALAKLFQDAGGETPEFESHQVIRRAALEADHEMIIEIQIEMLARGRPRLT